MANFPRPHLTPQYIYSSDPTLLCSRDGHLALKAWLRLRAIGGWHGVAAMARRAVRTGLCGMAGGYLRRAVRFGRECRRAHARSSSGGAGCALNGVERMADTRPADKAPSL
jgi:hypothetical protein